MTGGEVLAVRGAAGSSDVMLQQQCMLPGPGQQLLWLIAHRWRVIAMLGAAEQLVALEEVAQVGALGLQASPRAGWPAVCAPWACRPAWGAGHPLLLGL